MKFNYFFAGAAIALLSLSSCDKDDNVRVEETSGVVKLHATINGHVQTRLGDAWAGESVGFYMIEDNTEFTPVISNKKYTVSSDGAMTPADGEEATYPTDGSDVYFISYHPYSEALVNHVYPIDLTDESIADHDLVYAKVGPYNQTQEESVSIPHEHQLTLLAVNVLDAEGTAITTATAKINRPVKGSFDLKTGTLAVTENSAADMDMAAVESTVNAMIIPGAAGKIVFVNDEKSFTWDISSIAFEAGKKYTYTIKLIPSTTPDPEPTVVVVGPATITPWENEVVESTIDLDEDTSGDGDSTPAPVYTSNIKFSVTDGDYTSKSTTTYSTPIIIPEYDDTIYGVRLGSSSAGGEFETVSLAQGITKVSFYALGWNGDTTTLTVDYKDGEEDKTVSYSIISDAGFSGTSTTFTISIPSISSLYTIEFTTPCDGTNTLKFSTSGGKKRAIIFGINVE